MSTLLKIFETMEYGPAPESATAVNTWLIDHGRKFAVRSVARHQGNRQRETHPRPARLTDHAPTAGPGRHARRRDQALLRIAGAGLGTIVQRRRSPGCGNERRDP